MKEMMGNGGIVWKRSVDRDDQRVKMSEQELHESFQCLASQGLIDMDMIGKRGGIMGEDNWGERKCGIGTARQVFSLLF